MAYSVKVVIYRANDAKVIEHVRAVIELDGADILEITASPANDGTKELYIELGLGDPKLFRHIVRRVEAIPGAAVMASTEPTETPMYRKSKV